MNDATDFYQRGYRAQQAGRMAAPILDPEVVAAIAGREVGDPETKRIMREFQAGYEAAIEDELRHHNTEGAS